MKNNKVTSKYEDEVRELTNIVRSLPISFADTLLAHMDRVDCTVESLAEKSLVSEKTIQRMRNARSSKSRLETVVSICIGLQLDIILSLDLIEKSFIKLNMQDARHVFLFKILDSKDKKSIYEWNEILEENNQKTLKK
jgi:DNA-binding Xre family transcriptional regulator